MERITVKGTALVDESGRERIFNGVNLVFKGKFNEDTGKMDYFDSGYDEEMFKGLSERGINLVRLGIVWTAIEPTIGNYNEAYLDLTEKYVDWCLKYGIYVYLDVHQDCYHNMPDWATITDSYKRRKPMFIWAEGYFIDKAVHRAFDNFWNNTEICGIGIQDRFAMMWQHVAERFKDKDNLFGYDLLNEPFPGTDGGRVFKAIAKKGVKTILSRKVNKCQAIKNMIKGDIFSGALSAIDSGEIVREVTSAADLIILNFDVNKYYPFVQKVATAIRQVTDKGIIILETSYWGNSSIPNGTPRLRYADGSLEKNIVLAPHGYDLTVDTVLTNTASNNRIDAVFNTHAKTQKRLGIPMIVGEWGGMVPGCDDYPHLEYLLEKFDNNKWGQTYWCFWKDLIDDKIMKIIARPYPIAVPGEIVKYSFNRKNDTFTLKYNLEESTRKKIKIYSPCMPKEVIAKGKVSYEKINNSDAVIISVGANKGENTIEVKI